MEPDSGPAPAARGRGRLKYLAMIAGFDIAGPLAAYWLLRSAGLGPVQALVLSGVFPALGVAVSYVRARRLDAIGGLALAGIAVGTILGLATPSASSPRSGGSATWPPGRTPTASGPGAAASGWPPRRRPGSRRPARRGASVGTHERRALAGRAGSA